MMTIFEALSRMEAGTLTAEQLVRDCLRVIEEKDGTVGAFLEVFADEAIKRAQEIDARRSRGELLGALAGIPISIKDNLLYSGHAVTASSKILEGYTATYTATVVQKLLDADAIIIGRTNMDEFACGSSTEHSAYQKTTNPLDSARVPGGSSGGAAASVAAGMCLAALGTDTGGSVRQPAGFCGVVGMKPTYGRVSRFGAIAMASSLDQVGPLGNTVDCVSRVLAVIEGADGLDATATHVMHEEATTSLQGIRVGIPREYILESLDVRVRENLEAACDSLRSRGAEIIDISLPHTSFALPTYYVLMPSELSSNLARFDGMRYGLSKGNDLKERYALTRDEGFGDEIKRRILLGTFSLSSGYSDEYYNKSVAMREVITQDFTNAFTSVDVILSPTSPTVAFAFGEKTSDPLAMYLADIFTVSANLAGVPAVSVPFGTIDGLPLGVQVMAPHFKDNYMLAVAALLETSV